MLTWRGINFWSEHYIYRVDDRRMVYYDKHNNRCEAFYTVFFTDLYSFDLTKCMIHIISYTAGTAEILGEICDEVAFLSSDPDEDTFSRTIQNHADALVLNNFKSLFPT